MTRKFIKFDRAMIDLSKIIGIIVDSGRDGYVILEGKTDPIGVYGNMSGLIDLFIKLGDIEVYEAQ